MNNDIERMLESLTPRGAPADLRDKVLGAVAIELAARRNGDVSLLLESPAEPFAQPRAIPLSSWSRPYAGMGVAVSLMLGVMFNMWAIRSDDVRQARLFGPVPLPREIREAVEIAEQVAGGECAQYIQQRLVSAWQSQRRAAPLAVVSCQRQLIQLILSGKELRDVQADRYRPGRPDRSALDRQRGSCLA